MSPTDAAVRRCAVVVALTGGIASGKGAVGDRFARLGAPLFDADRVSRDLVQPGQPALADIVEAFGAESLTTDGQLDRRRMRERVFADPAARRRLEAILHPRVHDTLRATAAACTASYCIVVIPLLVEVRDRYAFVDRALVVDVSPETQVQRLVRRDACSEAAAMTMIAAQASRASRLAIADDVIDNDGSIAALDPIIARLHAIYLRAGDLHQR